MKWQSDEISKATFAKVQFLKNPVCVRGYRIPHDPSTWVLAGVVGFSESNERQGRPRGRQRPEKAFKLRYTSLDFAEEKETGFPSSSSGRCYRPQTLSLARFW